MYVKVLQQESFHSLKSCFTKLSCKDNNFMKKVREVWCNVHRVATTNLVSEVSFSNFMVFLDSKISKF